MNKYQKMMQGIKFLPASDFHDLDGRETADLFRKCGFSFPEDDYSIKTKREGSFRDFVIVGKNYHIEYAFDVQSGGYSEFSIYSNKSVVFDEEGYVVKMPSDNLFNPFGPARITNEEIYYCTVDLHSLHREDGPAIISLYSEERYYLKGLLIEKEVFDKMICKRRIKLMK